MLAHFGAPIKQLRFGWRRLTGGPLVPPAETPVPRAAMGLCPRPPCPLSLPAEVLPAFVRACPVTMRVHALLGVLDWAHFPERPQDRPWPGPAPAPRAPYAAAFLVKLHEGQRSMGDLRRLLVEHPALVWLLGFPLVSDDSQPFGFDVQASLPCARQFSRVLRTLPNATLQFLLDSAVRVIEQRLPAGVLLGETVAGDTKHIIAWVKENNPKAYVRPRYDKTKQPAGDPDCRLGVKKKRNRSPETHATGSDDDPTAAPTAPASPPDADLDASSPTIEGLPASSRPIGVADELYWGYASGVIATKIPGWGAVVLAERTDTFDVSDIADFHPLMADVERRLGRRPTNGAFDAAFDAFSVYEYFHQAGGFAAVPYVHKGGHAKREFDAQGLPLCAAGLGMPLKYRFMNRTSAVPHEKGKYACPLLVPQPGEAVCPLQHPKWETGGCETTIATSIGARLRAQLDRDSDAFKAISHQRTADERINALAVDLGIERPQLRNRRSIANQNSLIYLLLDLRALARHPVLQEAPAAAS